MSDSTKTSILNSDNNNGNSPPDSAVQDEVLPVDSTVHDNNVPESTVQDNNVSAVAVHDNNVPDSASQESTSNNDNNGNSLSDNAVQDQLTVQDNKVLDSAIQDNKVPDSTVQDNKDPTVRLKQETSLMYINPDLTTLKSSVWEHFLRTNVKDGERYNSKCLHCGLIFKGARPQRMRSHLLINCRQIPQQIRLDFTESLTKETSLSVALGKKNLSAIPGSATAELEQRVANKKQRVSIEARELELKEEEQKMQFDLQSVTLEIKLTEAATKKAEAAVALANAKLAILNARKIARRDHPHFSEEEIAELMPMP